jgi:hypothetical protein
MRKKWEAQKTLTPGLVKSREKRKWQIALRRYVLERNPCHQYAPYFGLDINHFRLWIENQFVEGQSWENFGKDWQFEHIVPVAYFNFDEEQDLRLCWNFINITLGSVAGNESTRFIPDLLFAQQHFQQLYTTTNYPVCATMLEKIAQITTQEGYFTGSVANFIQQKRDYLDSIQDFPSFGFELLNSGRPLAEVEKELDFIKKYQ